MRTARLDAVQAHVAIGQEGGEDAERVRPAAHARDHVAGESSFELEDLRARLAPDHTLEVAHDGRIRMRAHRRPDDVMRRAHVRHPVANGFVGGILERARARRDRHHRRTQQLHAAHVGTLARDVDLAHVDRAFHAEECGDGGGRDPVLAGTRLGHEPALVHATREQRLPDAIVDLVRAGVIQVLALQVHARRRPRMRRSAMPDRVATVARHSCARRWSSSFWKAASCRADS